MAEEKRVLDIGAVCILADTHFIEGHTTGWLQFYDERYRPTFPLDSQTVCEYLKSFINEPRPDSWRFGCIVGWIEALIENSPQTFKSVLAGEHVSVVREVAHAA
jgi:hypothetical protein